MKIGIIGLGFVGSAVRNAYELAGIETICSDPFIGLNCSQNDILQADAIFVCVPSPQLADGACDTTILESVLEYYKNYSGIFISKVTADPLKYLELQLQYKNLVHAPEFLVAATAKDDYANGTFAIIGGHESTCKHALPIIRAGQPLIQNYKICSIQEAALTKYTINSFLATKVIFMNQIKKLASRLDVDYDTIIECVKLDARFGNSHLAVPGPDGKYGYGGACFPKDTAAILYLSRQLDVELTVLAEVIRSNNHIQNPNVVQIRI